LGGRAPAVNITRKSAGRTHCALLSSVMAHGVGARIPAENNKPSAP
jgi:hypothetical protein